MNKFKTIKNRGRERRKAELSAVKAYGAHKTAPAEKILRSNVNRQRATKARSKMLKARAEAQAFNQSIWSTVAFRHGGRVNDPTVKTMLGQGKSETE